MAAAVELQIIDPAFRVWVSLGFIVGLTPFIWTSGPFLVFGIDVSHLVFIILYGFCGLLGVRLRPWAFSPWLAPCQLRVWVSDRYTLVTFLFTPFSLCNTFKY